MAYGTATLTGTYKTFDNQPAEGVVEIIPNSRSLVDAEGNVVLAGRVKVTLDAAGSFTVTLPATDDATVEPATGRQYTVVAKLRHTHLAAVTGVELATGATVDIADVASVPVVDATVTAAATVTQLEALQAEVDAHEANTANPHAVTKTQVGLGLVDNVSAASLRDRTTHTGTQPAASITGLAPVATSGSKADVGLGNVDNTSDAAKPVSTAQAAALALKQDAANLDADVAPLVTSGGATDTALSASYEVGVNLGTYLDPARVEGVTDDSAALQAAITAAAGKRLVLGGRSLRVESTVTVSANDTTIDATGATIDLIDDGTAAGVGIKIENCARVTWTGGTLTQTAAARTGVYGLFSTFNVQDLTIDSPTIAGGSSSAFYGEQLDGFVLRNFRARNSKADGIHISRGSKDGQIIAPLIVACEDDAVAIVSVTNDGATVYDQCARIAVTDPIIRNLNVLGSGVAFVGAKDCTLTGGIIEDTVAVGVRVTEDTLAGTHRPSDVTITGTKVRSAGSNGFTIGDSDDVTLNGCTSQGATGIGLALLGATRCITNGGKFRGGGDVGVYDNGGGTGNHLIGVDLRGNTGGASAGSMTLTSCITV